MPVAVRINTTLLAATNCRVEAKSQAGQAEESPTLLTSSNNAYSITLVVERGTVLLGTVAPEW